MLLHTESEKFHPLSGVMLLHTESEKFHPLSGVMLLHKFSVFEP